MAGKTIEVGYLHIGAREHGVARYGRVLAEAARTHLGATVVEARVESASVEALQAAARQLAGADVVHVQYNGRVWGGPWQAGRHLRVFAEAAPPLVATIHDVRDGGYGPVGSVRRLGRKLAERLRQKGDRASTARRADEQSEEAVRREKGVRASLRRALRFLMRDYHNVRTTRWLMRHAARIFVCSEEEKHRLSGFSGYAERVAVIPHFVEGRTLPLSRRGAQRALGLAPGPVLTVLGFIHRSKGHALALDALPLLPEDVHLVFAGAPARNSPHFAAGLQRRAETLGVADRLRITGYLAEEDLERYLAATDVALCPFESMAASGSLSTWIAAGRPLLASDLPQIAEYNRMAPGAIATFFPHTPEALNRAARRQLSVDRSRAGEAARRDLQQQLAPKRIIERHASCYRQVVREGPTQAENKLPDSS